MKGIDESHLCDPFDDGAVAAPLATSAAAPRCPQHSRHNGPQVAAVRAIKAFQRAANVHIVVGSHVIRPRHPTSTMQMYQELCVCTLIPNSSVHCMAIISLSGSAVTVAV